jgi:hypothetical protein
MSECADGAVGCLEPYLLLIHLDIGAEGNPYKYPFLHFTSSYYNVISALHKNRPNKPHMRSQLY